MKNTLLILNIVLLFLVGILYYLHFKNNKPVSVKATKSTVVESGTDKNSADNANIAYIDLDSLQSNYGYYKKLKADFERRQSAANNEITAMQKKFQNRAVQLQQKANTMSPQEQESAMNEMNKMQQDLQIRKQNIDNDLFNENSKMKDNILKRIQDFLKDYNKDGKYSYIFSYEPGFMFYKDSTLNITPDVIKGLNDLQDDKKK